MADSGTDLVEKRSDLELGVCQLAVEDIGEIEFVVVYLFEKRVVSGVDGALFLFHFGEQFVNFFKLAEDALLGRLVVFLW